MKRLLALPFVLLPLLFLALAGQPFPDDEPTGVVRDATGAPLPGVLVTALRADSVVAVTVVTDTEGRYVLPSLPDGAYHGRAHRIGYKPSASVPLAAEQDFVLTSEENVFDQMPSSAFLGLLPDGEDKRHFVLDCAGCHQFDQKQITLDGKLRARDSWLQRTNQMLSFAGAHTGFPVISPSRDAEKTTEWLLAHVGGPDDPLPAFTPPPPMTGEDANVVITEYDLPVPYDLPHDLLPDAEGQILITGMMTAQMYRLNPATGHFATVPIPVQHAGPRALDLGPYGRWWVLLGNPRQIGVYDPAEETWAMHDIGMYPHSIKLDDAGRVWFNGHFTKEPELIGYLDAATGEVTTYEVPTPPMPDGGTTMPYGLRIDAEGTLWATQLIGNRLIKFVPKTEAFTLYELPTPVSGPRRPAIGPDGAVWIPQFAANKLARFDPATETFTEYPLPLPDALPYVVRVDPRTGVVWIATAGADAVLRFDPATERFFVHRLPTQKALVRHMELDATGAAWVAYGNSPATDPKIARLEIRD